MNNLNSKPGFVYFVEGFAVISDRIVRMVKIGHTTTKPEKRLRGLQKYSPGVLTLLGSVPGTKGSERKYHEKFHYLRHHGEWFVCIKGLRTLISGLNPEVRSA